MKSTKTSHLKRTLCMVMAILMTFGVFFNAAFAVERDNGTAERKYSDGKTLYAPANKPWKYYSDDGELVFYGNEIEAIPKPEADANGIIPLIWADESGADISGSIKTITIMNTVKSIGANAFRGLKVAIVGIPKTVTNINAAAFAESSITTVYYEGLESAKVFKDITGVKVYYEHKCDGDIFRHAIAATCIKEGYEGDKYCSICGALYDQGDTIKKTDHKWSKDKAYISGNPETCTTGEDKATYCEICGIFDYSTVENVPADPEKHHWVVLPGDKVENCKAHFTESGEKEFIIMHCDNPGCNAVINDPNNPSPYDELTYKRKDIIKDANGKIIGEEIKDYIYNGKPAVEDLEESIWLHLKPAEQEKIINRKQVAYNVRIKKLSVFDGNHHYTTAIEKGDEPSCTKDGTARVTCEWCTSINTSYTIPATGHGETYEVITNATCEATGLKVTKCKDCDAVLTSEVIPTRHTEGNWSGYWKTIQEPTCIQDGYQWLKCNYCGKYILDENKHYIKKDLPRTPNQHGNSRWFTTLPPTCTEKGEEIQVCTNVGCPYYSSNTEIGQKAVRISDRQAIDAIEKVIRDTNPDHYNYNESGVASDNRITDVANAWALTLLSAYRAEEEVNKTELVNEITTALDNYLVFDEESEKYVLLEKKYIYYYEEQTDENGNKFNMPFYGKVTTEEAAKIGTDATPEELVKRIVFSEIVEEAIRLFLLDPNHQYVIITPEQLANLFEEAWLNIGTREMDEVVEKLPANVVKKVTDQALAKKVIPELKHTYEIDPASSRVPYIQVNNEFIPVCKIDGEEGWYRIQGYDEAGNPLAETTKPVFDGEGNPVMETVTQNKTDENGNPILKTDPDGNYIPELDENGDPKVDENGDPVYQYETEDIQQQKTEIDKAKEFIPGEAVTYVNCLEGGGNMIYQCKRCMKLDEPKLVKQGSHKLATMHVAPTCYKNGYDRTYCELCDYYQDTQGEIKLEHNFVETVIKESTCSKAGIKVKICSYCDLVNTATYQTLATLPHQDKPVNEAPTCTVPGRDGVICSVCGRFSGAKLDALGHNYKNNVVEPTCTEQGYTIATCTRCGESKDPDNYVAVAGHQFGKVVSVAANCEHGSYIMEECKVCGYQKIYDEKDNALGHSMSVISAVAPTCTEYGRTEKIYCSRPGCGYVQKESQIVDPLGHTPGAEPTCTKAQTCIRCSYVFKPAKGHTPNRAEAGCEEDKVCTTCGMILDLHTGHSYGDWQIKKEATPFRKGIKARTCANCGGVEEQAYRLTLFQSIRWIFTHFLDIILALLGRANGVFN